MLGTKVRFDLGNFSEKQPASRDISACWRWNNFRIQVNFFVQNLVTWYLMVMPLLRTNLLLGLGIVIVGIISPCLQIALAYLYFRKCHIWSRVLNAALEKSSEQYGVGCMPVIHIPWFVPIWFRAIRHLVSNRVLHWTEDTRIVMERKINGLNVLPPAPTGLRLRARHK